MVLKDVLTEQMKFQSLFFWKSRFNCRMIMKELLHHLVSILVFLEVPLQPASLGIWIDGFHCFNPCFSGSPASTFFVKSYKRNKLWFQSLFFWKSRFNIKKKQLIIQNMKSFNPCFSGSPASTMFHMVYNREKIVFQSLFFWKSRFNPRRDVPHR